MAKCIKEYQSGDEDIVPVNRGYLRRFPLAKAVFLSRVHWHYLVGKSGKTFKKVKRKDKYFIVKTRAQWAAECEMSLDQVDSAIEYFRMLGLISTENHLIPGGLRVLHLRYRLVEGDGVINPKTFFLDFQDKMDDAFLSNYQVDPV